MSQGAHIPSLYQVELAAALVEVMNAEEEWERRFASTTEEQYKKWRVAYRSGSKQEKRPPVKIYSLNMTFDLSEDFEKRCTRLPQHIQRRATLKLRLWQESPLEILPQRNKNARGLGSPRAPIGYTHRVEVYGNLHNLLYKVQLYN